MKTLDLNQMEKIEGGGWWSDWGADAAALISGPGSLISLGLRASCALAGAGWLSSAF